MKIINEYILERLKLSQKNIKYPNEFDFTDFVDFIIDQLNYELTAEDFDVLKKNYLEENNLKRKSFSFNDIKFINVSNDNVEWNFYLSRIAKLDNNTFNEYYIIQKLNKGIIFHYNKTNFADENDIRYRIGYILDDIHNKDNKNCVKIFKVETK